MQAQMSGGCLCGAVRYRAAAAPLAAVKCYCAECRRTSGTGHATHVVMPTSAVAVTGAVNTYSNPADSGSKITRAFCPTCGTIVYSLNSSMPGTTHLRGSTLDDVSEISPQFSVYACRAPAWDPVSPQLPAFDKMPPMRP
jgi:hypothetical protein